MTENEGNVVRLRGDQADWSREERANHDETDGLDYGGGGGNGGHMNERLARLETEYEHVRRDLDEIKADQKQVASDVRNGFDEMRTEFAKRPTKEDLTNSKLQWVGIGVAVVLLLLGGMGFLLNVAVPSLVSGVSGGGS